MSLPFNLRTYRDMLKSALNCGYQFIGFDYLENHNCKVDRLDDVDTERKGLILLRHDVDGCLLAAATMARLEAELGIASTYFLMWRSPCYNLMSRANQTFAESLIKHGHQIGLHYDQGYDALRDIPRHVTEASIQREASWLEELLNTKVHAVSFHQPSSVLLQEGINCGNRVNTYNKQLLSSFKYISDSNRQFQLWLNEKRNDFSYSDAIASSWPYSMQILVHPMWWVYEQKTTNLVWDSVIENNFRIMEQQLLATERAFGIKRNFSIQEDTHND